MSQPRTRAGLAKMLSTLRRVDKISLDPIKPKLTREEIESDWRVWLKTLFPRDFSGSFASYHELFQDWGWNLERGVDDPGLILVVTRKGGKSTHAEALCVSVGAKGTRRYILYVSDTQRQADDHLQNAANMLQSDKVALYYPELGVPAVTKYGVLKGWRQTRLRSASGLTIDSLGLDSAARGAKLEDQRPDLIIFDDCGNPEDSVDVVSKKKKIISRALIGAAAPTGATFCWINNLGHRDSITAQLLDGRADFMQDAVRYGPIPMFERLEHEIKGRKIFLLSGIPTWDYLNLERGQKIAGEMGASSFLVECQHRVDILEEESTFSEWSELHHVITWDEFADYYDQFHGLARDREYGPRIPKRWKKARGLDWGTTPSHPAACVFSTRPHILDPLSDCAFIFGEVVLPKWSPTDNNAHEFEAVSPGRVAKAIYQFQREYQIDEEDVELKLMSHEASAALNTFIIDLPGPLQIFFSKWKPKHGSGVPQIQEYLAIDRGTDDKPIMHPFRPWLRGRPRLYFVVARGQGEVYTVEGQFKVKPAIDHRGLCRLRWEIPKYNQHLKGAKKIDDDAVDGMLGMASKFFPSQAPATEREEAESRISEHLRSEAIAKLPPGEKPRAIEAQLFWLNETAREKELELNGNNGDKNGGSPYGRYYFDNKRWWE